MSSQMQGHLRTYVEDGIQQKIRLGNLIDSYEVQENKTRERIIDQTTLERKFIADGIVQQEIDYVAERKERDLEILERVQSTLTNSRNEMEGLTYRLNAHLKELTALEITAGGFVTHAIGIDKNTSVDETTKVVSFKAGGHVEIPIASRLNTWKDSSQLIINKIRKTGA